MINKLLKKIFGTRNERIIKTFQKKVLEINAFEPTLSALTDEALQAKTAEFKARFAGGESLDDLLAEAFAVVREASRRTLGLRHFDVQMLGGMILHHGKIAEMRTGEGKTLVATLPAYLNALAGKGVHIVTVNDYLVQRDSHWTAPVYEFLGLTIGVNLANKSHAEKQAAYQADITFGTNNEFGFDYLRDNMVYQVSECVQRELYYAVIDEVDSILIDEARTPLIISGASDESSDFYIKINALIPQLKQQVQTSSQKEEEVLPEHRGDYVVDEKNKQAHLTEQGHQRVEELLIQMGLLKTGESLYDLSNITLMHYINASLRAHVLYHKDVEYVVKNQEVIIVDEHTGRLMDGRRWSDGLHQAVEAKENVPIQSENQTLATITFQNFFRLYQKLSGMTGTADTEAFELQKIYGLEVIVTPTNKPMIRDDRVDQVYLTQKEKYHAIVEEIKACQLKKQPVLVGTASIESSELLSSFLNQNKIAHEVLNAKQHEREAKIIAQAGRPGAVTIATNMAGRGTDIVLGGNYEFELAELVHPSDEQITALKENWRKNHDLVLQSGGLHVLGTERHESRRIDNQLRGRSGRQGDPGSSQFFLSMEDNLLRIFASERMANMMRKLGIQEGEVIQHPWISRAIENAQRRVEGFNFDIRKNLLEYDDVANDQRKVIYQQRQRLLITESMRSSVDSIREEAVENLLDRFIPKESVEENWNLAGLEEELHQEFLIDLPIQKRVEEDANFDEEAVRALVLESVANHYQQKSDKTSAEVSNNIERMLMLQLLDQHWKDHLAAMDHLRQGIHLRGYAQKNPTQEFKRESFEMFKRMMDQLKYEYIMALSRVDLQNTEVMPDTLMPPALHMTYQHADFMGLGHSSVNDAAPMEQKTMPSAKVGRNDACPCGSGKKYKQCHGALD